MISERLTKAILNNKLSHAYIIEGDSLTNKLEYAYDFAKAILCKDAPGTGCGKCRTCRMIEEETYRDFYHVTGDEKSVKDKDIEELQERLSRLPVEDGMRNIAIIEKADTMTTRAQNRILKSLEEPFPGTVIVLLAENSDNLLPTIKSRCQIVRLYGDFNKDAESEYLDAAKALIEKAKKKSYFFETKAILDEALKDRGAASALLDAIERVLRDDLLKMASSNEADNKELGFYLSGIRSVELARRELKYNIRDKYILSDLMLKIGG